VTYNRNKQSLASVKKPEMQKIFSETVQNQAIIELVKNLAYNDAIKRWQNYNSGKYLNGLYSPDSSLVI
jgi:hypothetical protein